MNPLNCKPPEIPELPLNAEKPNPIEFLRNIEFVKESDLELGGLCSLVAGGLIIRKKKESLPCQSLGTYRPGKVISVKEITVEEVII